ncbi:NifU N-terminal domain-containing protein [Paenibacillus thailandensis]|uniref:NifU N-terminal domain-containing protein n=1 Tax=Paenibacillus thailandensis TaxID=393250 RepID=A0ABW5QYJ2_9BACL
MSIQISFQETPNPNAVKVNASAAIFEGPSSISLKSGAAADHPLAAALLGIEGVDNIFGIRDFVTVTKTPDADWDAIIPQIEEAFDNVYE